MNKFAQAAEFFVSIKYDYPNVSQQHRAHSLLRVARGTVGVCLAGLIVLLLFQSRRPLFHIVDYPVGITQILYFIIFLLSIVTLGAVVNQLNRGNLNLASVLYVIFLFVIGVLGYISSNPTGFLMLTFSLPVVGAGALLDRKGLIYTLSAIATFFIGFFIVEKTGFLDYLFTAQPSLMETLAFSTVILIIDGIILNVFAGGQRVILEANLALTQELKTAVDATEKASRAYQLVSEGNQLVAQATDEDRLLEDVCTLIIEKGGYQMSWIGFVEDDPDKSIHLVARAGDDNGLLEAAPMTWQNNNNPTAMAIRTRAAYAAQHIPSNPTYSTWRSAAVESGLKSSLSLPLRADERILGALNIYSSEAKAFNRSEIDLLSQLTSNLAYGVLAIRARRARAEAEAERAQLQEQIIEAQQRAIRDLSTPIIPIIEGVIIVPLIGDVDSARARDITQTLLAGIGEHQATTVIIDVTGVPLVDSGVANHLNKTINAAHLKGTRTLVTGISPEIAETIVNLGIDWSELETIRDLQTGLRLVMRDMKVTL